MKLEMNEDCSLVFYRAKHDAAAAEYKSQCLYFVCTNTLSLIR